LKKRRNRGKQAGDSSQQRRGPFHRGKILKRRRWAGDCQKGGLPRGVVEESVAFKTPTTNKCHNRDRDAPNGGGKKLKSKGGKFG